MEEQWDALRAEATETQARNAERVAQEHKRVERARELLADEERSQAPVDNSEQLQYVGEVFAVGSRVSLTSFKLWKMDGAEGRECITMHGAQRSLI